MKSYFCTQRPSPCLLVSLSWLRHITHELPLCFYRIQPPYPSLLIHAIKPKIIVSFLCLKTAAHVFSSLLPLTSVTPCKQSRSNPSPLAVLLTQPTYSASSTQFLTRTEILPRLTPACQNSTSRYVDIPL